MNSFLIVFFLFYTRCISLIQHNAGLTEFPDIPDTDTQVYLGGNWISHIPDDKVSHFLCLRRFQVDDNLLMAVPDLRPLAGCLEEVNFNKNK